MPTQDQETVSQGQAPVPLGVMPERARKWKELSRSTLCAWAVAGNIATGTAGIVPVEQGGPGTLVPSVTEQRNKAPDYLLVVSAICPACAVAILEEQARLGRPNSAEEVRAIIAAHTQNQNERAFLTSLVDDHLGLVPAANAQGRCENNVVALFPRVQQRITTLRDQALANPSQANIVAFKDALRSILNFAELAAGEPQAPTPDAGATQSATDTPAAGARRP